MIPEIEKARPAEITKFQGIKLRETITYLNNNSPFYKKLFQTHNINPDKIRELSDLSLIPPTTKKDLQQSNREFLCVPQNKIIDYITTSGILGEPVSFMLTDADLERLAYNEYISFICAGGTKEDIYQLMCTMDRRFMAGLAYFLGIRKLGAGIIRTGAGVPQLQLETILRFKPTALVAVPSFLVKLIEYAENANVKLAETSIKKAICIGEPLRNHDFTPNTLANRILQKWDIKLYSTYASTEMASAFTECSFGCGGHHHPELIIVEFLDENNNPVSAGELGEVTITTLGIEGMPLLRFKTGDLCYHYSEPCKCGRNTMRLGPIIGRRQQMIKYLGTTIYPNSLYNILNDISGIANFVVEVRTSEIGTDNLLIKIGTKEPPEPLREIIESQCRTKLRVVPHLEFESPEAVAKIQLPEMSRKPLIFFDYRKSEKIK